MKCEICGKDYPNRLHFVLNTNICAECNQRESLVCPNCGSQRIEGKRICNNCKYNLIKEELPHSTMKFDAGEENITKEVNELNTQKQKQGTNVKHKSLDSSEENIISKIFAATISGLFITYALMMFALVFKGGSHPFPAFIFAMETILFQTSRSGTFYLIWGIVSIILFFRSLLND